MTKPCPNLLEGARLPLPPQVFMSGLVSAARSTDAWIITGGTDTGVMALVAMTVPMHILLGISATGQA